MQIMAELLLKVKSKNSTGKYTYILSKKSVVKN